jgi:RNA-directed DNA polymerase
MLSEIGLACHDPFSQRINHDKASFGKAESGFVFLGYDIRPGLFQPSLKARQKLESLVEGHIYLGRQAILDVKASGNSFANRKRYAQTLTTIDKVLRGWGEAFSYGNVPTTIDNLDFRIDKQLNEFRSWFSSQMTNQDWKTRRRLGGVCLLGDVKQKALDDVPFILGSGSRFFRSSNTVTISTDGALAVATKKKGKDQGPGGWSFVIHEAGEEHKGRVISATNNQMELRAVIEAMRFVDPTKSIVIRTDSQYVESTINRQNTIRTNGDLWREFQEVRGTRSVKITWVKGHAGDLHNERADFLAGEQANLMNSILKSSEAKIQKKGARS